MTEQGISKTCCHDKPTRIFLFDVDGTLVDAGGAGRRSFTAAFRDVFGRENAFADITMSGRTDPWILRAATSAVLGRGPTKQEEAAFIERYLELLVLEVESSERYRVLPGVRDVLHALHTRPRCLLGLATGNYERGARLKLERAGLNHFFSFGGFGSDDADRARLTQIAIERGEAIAKGPVKVTVVGDSPHDAAAARANNAKVALVGSGWTSREELLALCPDYYFDSLADAPTVVSTLLGEELYVTVCDVERVIECVRSGGVICYPTSTVYGIGGDAMNPEVVERVGRIKGGRTGPFIVLAANIEQAFGLVHEPPDTARRLALRFWPGPLTLVMRASARVPRHLLGPDGTIAIRVDSHTFCLALTKVNPVISTSANFTGMQAPVSATQVLPAIAASVDLFVKDEAALLARPSTIVQVEGDNITVLREGAIPANEVHG